MRRAVAGLASLSLLGGLVPLAVTAAPAAAQTLPGLIISEYVEGSSNNKALEIYNGTGAEVDLVGYRVQQYSNGSTTVGNTIDLTGTVADGEVFVVAHTSWALAFTPDQSAGGLNFNGNDALVLLDGDTVVDSFGRVGENPGDQGWGTAPDSTTNTTLARNPGVCAGDTIVDDEFQPTLEWTVLPQDTITGLGAHSADCGDAQPQEPVINEFSASTAGTDVEYLEVLGAASTDYSDLTILEVEGDATSAARGTVLSSHTVGTTDAAGYWLSELPADTIQNGTLTLLMVAGYTGGTVVDENQDGELDTFPWAEIVDSVAVHDGGDGDLTYSETVLGIAYDGLAFAPGGASRIPNGADTDTAADWMRNDFDLYGIPGVTGSPVVGEAVNTPGAVNAAYEEQPPPAGGECGDPVTLIGAVQGSGASSPVVGETVTIEGTVVGDFQHAGSFDGFYVQDQGDDDPATSDGVFVASTTPVDEADQVRVTGVVGENFGLTQVTGGEVLVCAQGAELPAPVVLELPLPEAEKEAHEGMLTTFPQDLAILEYFNYGRFGEVVIGTERQFQPTAVHAPGSPEAVALLERNLAERITLDDGLNIQNPEVTRHPNGEPFALDNIFRGGDLVTDAVGVLDYRFNLWRIQPTGPATYTAVNERPAVPQVGGDTTVAAFNVLNYFTTLGSRGAVDAGEFERQEAKIVAALAELDADVVGLIEIENNDDVALAALTAALNAHLGAEVYDYVATGVIGTDEITTAFIYQAAAVEPVGQFATLTETEDPRFDTTRNRPTLAQTFQPVGGGEPVTVAVNHLKSKGSECLPDDPDAGDGQGNCNLTRTAAAEAMADWLAADPTGTGAPNTLIIGDLNSYDKEDPIVALQDAGYTDLLLDYQGEYEYTYVFDGQLGYLDHALANGSAASLVTGAASWYINADEVSLLDYTTRFKPPGQQAIWAPDAFRSSDHDPVLIGLDLVDPVDRIFGPDRYGTAAEIAAEFGPTDTVYLASGQAFPDALAGAAPAARDGHPVLLTRESGLHPAAAAALTQIQPTQVLVLGGAARVPDAVLAEVETLTGAEVTRVAGTDRYATAAELAGRFEPGQVETVYVASGEDFADALAAAALAGTEGHPVLLTRAGSLPAATASAVERLAPSRIVVLGGSARIQGSVLDELSAYASSVERLAGSDRYATAALIAARIPAGERAFVASGQEFPDALAGAALAGHLGAPVLLTRPATLPGATAAAVTTRSPQRVTILGGTAAVSEAVADQLRALPDGS